MNVGVALGLACLWSQIVFAEERMVLIPGGSYVPFYFSKDPKATAPEKIVPVPVVSFYLDRYPVTREEFLAFVRKNPQWRKLEVKRLFADAHYLADWKSDFSFAQDPKTPVTNVSWFAANAYCRSYRRELPTTDQWEYVAADRGRGTSEAKARILSWYAKPNPKNLPRVGHSPTNGFGVYDLYGLVWEWTLDFNSATVGEESRNGGSTDENLFCGNGSQGALDSTDYASFMRYSFRSSLKASYTVANLGFRCAKGATP